MARERGVRRRFIGCVLVAALSVTALACTDSSGNGESRSSLAGADVDGNGVRDDVDAKVGQLTSDPAVAAYLLAVARNQQQVVTFDTGAPDAADTAFALASETDRLMSCPPAGIDDDRALALFDQVARAVANTPSREAQVDELGALIDGRSFYAPRCDQPAPTSVTPST